MNSNEFELEKLAVNEEEMYYEKYIKYKNKYTKLKKQKGGALHKNDVYAIFHLINKSMDDTKKIKVSVDEELIFNLIAKTDIKIITKLINQEITSIKTQIDQKTRKKSELIKNKKGNTSEIEALNTEIDQYKNKIKYTFEYLKEVVKIQKDPKAYFVEYNSQAY